MSLHEASDNTMSLNDPGSAAARHGELRSRTTNTASIGGVVQAANKLREDDDAQAATDRIPAGVRLKRHRHHVIVHLSRKTDNPRPPCPSAAARSDTT